MLYLELSLHLEKGFKHWKSKIICDSLSEPEVSIDAAISIEYIKREDNSGDKTRKNFKLNYT